MKKLAHEFKEFISKGNVIDLAVGVIIGGAFGKIVSSLVADIIMPFIGYLTGSVDLTDLKLIIKPATGNLTDLSIKYGVFLQNVIDFLIISVSVFIMIKLVTKLRSFTEKEVLEDQIEGEPGESSEQGKQIEDKSEDKSEESTEQEKQIEGKSEESNEHEKQIEEKSENPTRQESLLMEIRDLLKNKEK